MLDFATDGRGLGLGDLAFLDTAGANPEPLGVAVHQRLHCLQIHAPATPGDVVGVRDIIAELRAFPADIAYLRHDLAPNSGVSRRRGYRKTHTSRGLLNLHYTRNRRLGQTAPQPGIAARHMKL